MTALYQSGDCLAARTLEEATLEGMQAALAIRDALPKEV